MGYGDVTRMVGDRMAWLFRKRDGISVWESTGKALGLDPPARDVRWPPGPLAPADWRTVTQGCGTVDTDLPVELAVLPTATANEYSNAEVLSRPAYPNRAASRSDAVTRLDVRVRGRQGHGLVGSRGWGFGNSNFLAPLSSYAFFTDIRGPQEANTLPVGFYAFVQAPGGRPAVERLTDNLPDEDRDYSVVVHRDAVHFLVDGQEVSRSTAVVPRHRMNARFWVDNAGYVTRRFLGRDVSTRLQFLAIPVEARLVIDRVSLSCH